MLPLVPTLILDRAKCQANIIRMSQKAIKNKVNFRPHFKTHQSAEIGKWFKNEEVKSITVSSVSMAFFFADNGWDDITIAFPVNILEISYIKRLSERINLNLLVEGQDSIEFLRCHLKSKTGIFIKIDCGYHRTGISPENVDLISDLINIIKPSEFLEFRGFLTHAGNTYHASSIKEIGSVYKNSIEQLAGLKNIFQ